MDVLSDTNVILRRLHRAHPQHRQARAAIRKVTADGNRICVTSQNLIEVWAVCSRPVEHNGLGLSPSQADRVVARAEISASRLPDSDTVYAEWRRLVVTHGVSRKKSARCSPRRGNVGARGRTHSHLQRRGLHALRGHHCPRPREALKPSGL
ncbi:MAG: type II toxin-antitoxin system VapC family toxin, partial [Bryobacteraceae bacterium]